METTLKVRKLKKYISIVLVLLMIMLPLSALAGEDNSQSNEETSTSQVDESSEPKSSVNEESKETENNTENESKEESKETEDENNKEQESEIKEEESDDEQNEEIEGPKEDKEESKKDEEETQQFMMVSMDDEFGIMSEHGEDVDLEFAIVPGDAQHAQGQLKYHVDLDVTETDGEEVEGYEDPIQELLFELTYYLSKISNAPNHNLAQVEMDFTGPDGGSLIVVNGFNINVSITGNKSWSYEVNTFYDSDNDVTYLLGLKLFANIVNGDIYENVLGNDGDSVSVAFKATPTLPGLYEFEVAAHLYREQGQSYVLDPIKYMENSGSNESVIIGPLDPDDPDPDDPDPDDPDPDDPDPDPNDPDSDDPGPEVPGLPFLPEVISFVLPDPTEPEEATTPLTEFIPVDLEPEEDVVEELEVAQEEPQVESEAVETQVLIQSPNLWWLLLLLLVPALIWFLLARLVLIRVPNEKGEYKTIARKLARRKEKRWFVEIEKQLNEYLMKHGEVLVDFRGGLIKEAKKAIYTGENLLSVGEVRYAIVNRQRSTVWVEELQKKQERIAG